MSKYLTTKEYDAYSQFFRSAYSMLWLVRSCLGTQSTENLNILYNLGDKVSDFGRFLAKTAVALQKINLRQTGNYLTASPEEFSNAATAITVGFLRSRLANPSGLGMERFRVSAEEAARNPTQIDPQTFVKVLDGFMLYHHNKEVPAHLVEITDAWKIFLKGDSAFSRECSQKKYGDLLSRMGVYNATNWYNNYRAPSPTIIENVLSDQKRIAQNRNIADPSPIQNRIRRILKTYEGLLTPEVLVFYDQSPEVTNLKRREFSMRKTKYLEEMGRKIMVLQQSWPSFSRIGSAALSAMVQRGSFDQTHQDTRIDALTVEHTAPLSMSDNFKENCSILAHLINHDMNTLVWLQTGALGYQTTELRTIATGKTSVMFPQKFGSCWPIIVLRPPLADGMHMPVTVLPKNITQATFRSREESRQIKRGFISVPGRIHISHLQR